MPRKSEAAPAAPAAETPPVKWGRGRPKGATSLKPEAVAGEPGKRGWPLGKPRGTTPRLTPREKMGRRRDRVAADLLQVREEAAVLRALTLDLVGGLVERAGNSAAAAGEGRVIEKAVRRIESLFTDALVQQAKLGAIPIREPGPSAPSDEIAARLESLLAEEAVP